MESFNLIMSIMAMLAIMNPVSTMADTRQRSNIVLFITDDLDLVLDGMTPLTKTRSWFESVGQIFTNAFVSTPVCCPSRSSLLTGTKNYSTFCVILRATLGFFKGRYQHNTHVVNNSVSGNCYGTEWTSGNGLEARGTFASIINQESGYETFYAGKYLNEYHGKAVPPGWDHWAGLIGNSRYYNYTLNMNGKLVEHGNDYVKDYLTDQLGHFAWEFLDNRSSSDQWVAKIRKW
jgi:N-acetylglucosamine-6-sulfatase